MAIYKREADGNIIDVLSGNESIKTDVGIFIDPISLILLVIGILLAGGLLIYLNKSI